MSFGSFDTPGVTQPMAEINTTPLVDVMLVLLVIFIITAPLFHQAVPIDLPKVESTRLDEPPRVTSVLIDGDGDVYVDGERLDRNEVHGLEARFQSIVASGGVPELHLRADRATRYERVTEVLAAAQKSGLTKIAFVTEQK
ncbi:MAG: biopolymer transporter ExbD [Betaproteobacteria bacterium]|jgi:biopolymer transport protein ExbD|uniref:Biopolymer transporter ExbD n=1 Tax=Candidatus Proximibacter danicus TaxID=2954365 RepID=A0A9D7K0B5_9PROT|nr:biopolymer transporter ExbD [Candidatus Proximibacter danicus]MBK9446385.1 biopolymer transporter ExbD [Betaproteobacteria bacterium]